MFVGLLLKFSKVLSGAYTCHAEDMLAYPIRQPIYARAAVISIAEKIEAMVRNVTDTSSDGK